MAKASFPFSNFTAGELSPRLDGRTDVSKYFNGCKTLQNFVIHPHGGASRRPGTKFVREVKTSSNFTRLIPFEFNVTQAYILEFGENYFVQLLFQEYTALLVQAGSRVRPNANLAQLH